MKKRGRGARTTSNGADKVKRRAATPSPSPSKFAGKTFYDPDAPAVHVVTAPPMRAPEPETPPEVLRELILPGMVVELDPATQTSHMARGCPVCERAAALPLRPLAVFPVPCRVRVSAFVECCATAAAEEKAHHYDCTFWEHYPERTPF